MFILSIRLVVNLFGADDKVLAIATMNTFLNDITLAITIIMVAVPEGLPLAVSIAAAYAINSLTK